MTINLRFQKLTHAFIATASFFTGSIAQNFPQGFSQVKVGNVYYPTAIAKTPDGRIFVCEKQGRVKVVKNGNILSTPFIELNNVEQTNERGLGGIAIDPNFATNKYVYLYYTTTNPVRNRLVRYTANGDVAQSGSGVVLVEFESTVNSIHNGGGMAFGPDGKLYLAMGDDKVSSNAQSMSTHKGKLLRMNADGSPASGNPFSGSTAASRIWAYGFRNPFSISIDPGTGKIFVNDVGEGAWEEINDATSAGKNFGWPGAEGNSSNTAYKNPVYTYHHTNGTALQRGCAVSGGCFFRPSSSNYPSQYIGKYFFIDYCSDWINFIDPSGGSATNFASNLSGSGIGLLAGADGNLYYMSISQSALYKIVYNGGSTPVITQQPLSQTVSAGQQVVFSVGASGTQPLMYQWKKNNINIQGANAASYVIQNASASHQGSYKVTVSNSAGAATSSSASLTVTAFNSAPVASINSPVSGARYRGGDTIFFSGNATDAEDGTLPASSFTWEVRFHHDVHYHPGANVPTGVKSGSFVIPYTGESSANVWYKLILYVKDSKGGLDTVSRDITPYTSRLTFVSSPPGLQLSFEGQPRPATYSLMAVERMKFEIQAPSPQQNGQTLYTFSHWAHGGNGTQTISVPLSDQTLTAHFQPSGTVACTAEGKILREYWANVSSTSLADIPFNTAPTGTSYVTQLAGPVNSGDLYGSRLRGFICPPSTGNYTFYIASDNSSELWLSTDDNPGNKKKIAFVSGYTKVDEWNKYPEQQSAPVALQSGQKYYVEVLHRENNQGDHVAVGWKKPGGIDERPIPGQYLSPPVSDPGNPSGCVANGTIVREVWNNLPGTDLQSIPLSSPPSSTATLTQFKAPSNSGDNFGARIRGYICPPQTGNYTFWIASDDNSELYLSTDQSPANKQKIAFVKGYTQSQEYTKYPSQKSAPIALVANQTYYIEAIHKEDARGDNLAVGWQLPSGVLERPIPGNRLSSIASSNALAVTLTSPTDGSYFTTGEKIVMDASPVGGTGTYSRIEFFNQGTKLGEDLSPPYSYTIQSAQTGTYHLTVKVTDSQSATATSEDLHVYVTPAGAACTGTGYITREMWNNVQGTSVSDIPLASTPHVRQQLTSFKSASDIGDNYGQRIRGYICPPLTGKYRFSICSDDNSELWLSTDDSPNSRQLIASVSGWTFPDEWQKYPSQTSGEITLEAGKKYYVEALHKEGSQGDHVAVGWRLPDNSFQGPVPGNYLIPFEDVPVAICDAFIQPGGATTFCEGGSVKLFANQGSGYNYQWKVDDVDIAGATSYSIKASDQGAYQVKIYYTGCNAWSAPEYVTVNDYLTARITPGGPTTFCEGENVLLYGNTCEDYQYQWKHNGSDIPGANSHTYLATITGEYQLKIISGSSISWSALQKVTVNDCGQAKLAKQQTEEPVEESTMIASSETAGPAGDNNPVSGLEKISRSNFNLKVFPNPTTGMFTFDYCIEQTKTETVEIRIISVASGQTVYNKGPEQVSGCVQANIGLSGDLPVGVYVLQLLVGERTESTKLILYR